MPTTTQQISGGNWELSIGDLLIDAKMLGDITVDFEEGTASAETQAGTFTHPTGRYDTAQASFTLFLPNMDYLGEIFPEQYTAGTGTQTTGNVILGGSACSSTTGKAINIHPVCSNTDDNDIHIFEGIIRHNVNATLSTADSITIDIEIMAQKTSNGIVRFGTGDSTKPSYWDVETQSTKPYTA